jgi:hypothetical protein
MILKVRIDGASACEASPGCAQRTSARVSHRIIFRRIAMRMHCLLVSLALAMGGGCAGGVKHSEPGRDHPASPSAAEAPTPPPSKTLAIDAPVRPSAEERGVVPPEVRNSATTQSGMMLYACPMHADVTSMNPNDRCPKCGMKINKPVKRGTSPATKPGAGGAPTEQHPHDHGGGNK